MEKTTTTATKCKQREWRWEKEIEITGKNYKQKHVTKVLFLSQLFLASSENLFAQI